MVKVITTLLISLSLIFNTWAQSSSIDHRVLLLGNIADVSVDDDLLLNFEKLTGAEQPFTILMNGDLIAEKFNSKSIENQVLKIQKLLEVLSKNELGQIIILSGDRDWANSGKNGLKTVKALEKKVKDLGYDNVSWANAKGCPGPNSFDIGENLVLVTLNTQWWNHPFDKPRPADGQCKIVTETDFVNELREELQDANGKNLLIAGHFPLLSVGEYGGKSSFVQHISPPLYGSIRAAFHQNIGNEQDIVNKRFDHIRKEILDLIYDKSATIYAGGHEHNLQVLKNEESFFVNSGSLSSPRFVGKDKSKVLFAKSMTGLIELAYYKNGKVDYIIHGYNKGSGFHVFKQETLLHSPCSEKNNNEQTNTAFIPCQTKTALLTSEGENFNKVAAGNYPAKGVKKMLFGKHYRSSWAQAIQVPVLDLSNTFGGLTVYEKGGGRQTTSLKMKGGNGREYVFRSVDKDPTTVLSRDFRGTFVADILKDVTSMQHPYGAMVVSRMLDETTILHAQPKLYVLPNNRNLGPFQSKYAGLLGMLEEKPINIKRVKIPFANANVISQSYKMFRALYKNHFNTINKTEYSQARMFDILVGDWGRHEDNWKWAGFNNNLGATTYRPIPRDRDHVFSRWDGFLVWLVDRKWGKQSGENFGIKLNDIRSLTWQSRHIDRYLLNDLTKENWIAAANYIQSTVTDKVIEESVATLPNEIYNLSGQEIEYKLKQRVRDLDKYAIEYYAMLSKQVDVVGSNKREKFKVIRNADGKVLVTMHSLTKQNTEGQLLFKRNFKPDETKEIRLYGLDGKDVFEISGGAKKSIKVRIIGGPAPDNIDDQSYVNGAGKKTLIYEKSNKGVISIGKEGKIISHWDKDLYNYDRTRFAYNRFRPIFLIGSNSTSGFGVSAGVSFTRQRFGKQDYSAKHSIKGRFTTENINIFEYNGKFRHVLAKWDVDINGVIGKNSDFNKFFGIGNNSVNVDELDDVDFYQTRYETFNVSAGLGREFWKKSQFRIGIQYENNESLIDPGTVLEVIDFFDFPIPGLHSANLISAKISLDLDFRDRADLPVKGMKINLNHESGVNSSESNKGYGITQAYIENFISFGIKNPLTLGLRVGGSKSYGEQVIPFYKMVYLGQQNHLRGYERNRFTGSSTLFLNSELRMQIAEFGIAIPSKLGIKGFYDVGRVYSPFDLNDDLHAGYGFGLYLVPVKESFAINISAGFSKEESGLILLTIGGAL